MNYLNREEQATYFIIEELAAQVEKESTNNKMSMIIYRKCENCGYFANRWCHWLGKPRHPKSEECEDGYKEKEKERIKKKVGDQ